MGIPVTFAFLVGCNPDFLWPTSISNPDHEYEGVAALERDGVTLPGDRFYGVDYILAGAPDCLAVPLGPEIT